MSNYTKGRAYEYTTMELWRSKGYSVIRAAGSHGLYDLIAFKLDRKPELIQCKVVKTESLAKGLLKKFKLETKPSSTYHQILTIKVHGSTIPIEFTI